MREVKFKRLNDDFRIIVDGVDHGLISKSGKSPCCITRIGEPFSQKWIATFLPDSKFRFDNGTKNSEIRTLEWVYLIVEEAVSVFPKNNESMKVMRERHKKEIEDFQAACEHEKISEFVPKEWAPGHIHSEVKYCLKCEKITEERTLISEQSGTITGG